jgi:hypothetical protein
VESFSPDCNFLLDERTEVGGSEMAKIENLHDE